jgi:hypothetical protein
MKRRDLIRHLSSHGCELDREGVNIPFAVARDPINPSHLPQPPLVSRWVPAEGRAKRASPD